MWTHVVCRRSVATLSNLYDHNLTTPDCVNFVNWINYSYAWSQIGGITGSGSGSGWWEATSASFSRLATRRLMSAKTEMRALYDFWIDLCACRFHQSWPPFLFLSLLIMHSQGWTHILAGTVNAINQRVFIAHVNQKWMVHCARYIRRISGFYVCQSGSAWWLVCLHLYGYLFQLLNANLCWMQYSCVVGICLLHWFTSKVGSFFSCFFLLLFFFWGGKIDENFRRKWILSSH